MKVKHIFQTTKEDNFRGASKFQHDMNIVIEVSEKGTGGSERQV
jgi:hypothetical protein